MILLLISMPYIRTLLAPKDNCRAACLVLKYVSVCTHLFTASVSVAALKLDLGEQISSNPVNLIELAIASAKWAMIWVFCEPMAFAISTNRLLADFALERVF